MPCLLCDFSVLIYFALHCYQGIFYWTQNILLKNSLHIQISVKWLQPSQRPASISLFGWLLLSTVGGGHTHPNLPELAVAQALYKLQWLPWDLPHIFGFDRQVGKPWHPFVARDHQATAKPCCPLWARTHTNINSQRKGKIQKQNKVSRD